MVVATRLTNRVRGARGRRGLHALGAPVPALVVAGGFLGGDVGGHGAADPAGGGRVSASAG
jgi:hypothetical protein